MTKNDDGVAENLRLKKIINQHKERKLLESLIAKVVAARGR